MTVLYHGSDDDGEWRTYILVSWEIAMPGVFSLQVEGVVLRALSGGHGMNLLLGARYVVHLAMVYWLLAAITRTR